MKRFQMRMSTCGRETTSVSVGAETKSGGEESVAFFRKGVLLVKRFV